MLRVIGFVAALVLLIVAFGVSGSPVAPTAEASPTTTTVYWGNYTVDGFSASTQLIIDVPRPCADCFLTVVSPELEYNNGGNWEIADYSNGAMLHHMVIFNHANIDPTCGPFVRGAAHF